MIEIQIENKNSYKLLTKKGSTGPINQKEPENLKTTSRSKNLTEDFPDVYRAKIGTDTRWANYPQTDLTDTQCSPHDHSVQKHSNLSQMIQKRNGHTVTKDLLDVWVVGAFFSTLKKNHQQKENCLFSRHCVTLTIASIFIKHNLPS